MTDIDDLAQLQALLEASEQVRLAKIEYEKRMDKINANSPKEEFLDKLAWLAANGKGSEIKKMIEERIE
jgi:hypothetical protein